MSLAIGDQAPDLGLPDTDGEEHALHEEGSPSVVVFTCNHCPYALAWHDRLVDAARDYAGRGVRFLAVNPNDAERYPADSYEAMRERVAATAAGRSPTCATRARRRRASSARRPRRTCSCSTPTGRLRYRGAPDADHMDPTLTRPGCARRSTRCSPGEEPARPETDPVGCSVKWRR